MKPTLLWGLTSWGLSGIFLSLGASYSRTVQRGARGLICLSLKQLGRSLVEVGYPGRWAHCSGAVVPVFPQCVIFASYGSGPMKSTIAPALDWAEMPWGGPDIKIKDRVPLKASRVLATHWLLVPFVLHCALGCKPLSVSAQWLSTGGASEVLGCAWCSDMLPQLG